MMMWICSKAFRSTIEPQSSTKQSNHQHFLELCDKDVVMLSEKTSGKFPVKTVQQYGRYINALILSELCPYFFAHSRFG